MPSASPFAVIFDLDGLMLDTERVELIGCRLAAEELGYTSLTDEIILSTVGRNWVDTKAIICEKMGTDFPYSKLLERWRFHSHALFEKHGVQVKPGLLPLLELFQDHCVPKAVATSTPRTRALDRLRNASILDHFQHIVAGDEIENGKPSPDIFLAAAARLGADPRACFVLEDSDAGVRAAHSAGMTPILVPDIKQPCDEVRTLARHVFPSLVEARIYFEGMCRGPF